MMDNLDPAVRVLAHRISALVKAQPHNNPNDILVTLHALTLVSAGTRAAVIAALPISGKQARAWFDDRLSRFLRVLGAMETKKK